MLFGRLLSYFAMFNKIFKIMGFDFLFHNDLPQGVKSVYVNGKRFSIEEFNQVKEKHLLKKADRIEP
tara:strand:+ start:307 stop:507 length:201 start_codon:yes stop_codon:yes gene_type:complete